MSCCSSMKKAPSFRHSSERAYLQWRLTFINCNPVPDKGSELGQLRAHSFACGLVDQLAGFVKLRRRRSDHDLRTRHDVRVHEHHDLPEVVLHSHATDR